MIKTSTILKTLSIAFTTSLLFVNSVKAQAITEEFDDITTLTAAGWEMFNVSNPIGSTAHFQGNDAVFPAFSGALPTSYIGANYNNTAGTGTISNWLLSPTVTLNNGDSISFYTQTIGTGTVYPDRLQLLYSTNGTSNDIGVDEFSVGDFSNVLVDINSAYSDQDWPTGYPFAWLRFDNVISGLAGPTSGRFALRYFVENGGPAGANSNYIGIDLVTYVPVVTGLNENINSNSISIYPNPATDFININLGKTSDENLSVRIFNAIGQEVKDLQMNKGNNKLAVDVRNLNTGLYQVLVSNGQSTYRKEIVKK